MKIQSPNSLEDSGAGSEEHGSHGTTGPGISLDVSASPGAAAVREGQTYAGDSLLARYASFVKLPHTLFALPFAGVGVILGSYIEPAGVTPGAIVWIILAFTAARFAAMGFNRIVDRDQDALNPRTRLRELPAGKLTVPEATLGVIVASAIFIFAAWQLNPLCGWLSPLALGWVLFYSYTKRFTALAHAVLGFGLAIAPVGGYLAVTGQWSDPWWALLVLAAAITFWVAGFDIIYSVQDEAFDRAQGLRSIPASLGTRRALEVARLFHFLAVLGFAGIWFLFPLGWLYLGGAGMMAVLLHFGHAGLRGRDAEQLDLLSIDRAFFRVNVGVSTGCLLFTLLDRVLLG